MTAHESFGVSSRLEFDNEVQFVLDNFDRKLARLSAKLAILKHVYALYRFVVDPQVHWTKKVLVVSALVYFIIPLDAIPDFTPVVGFADDAFVVAAAVRTIGKALAKYYD